VAPHDEPTRNGISRRALLGGAAAALVAVAVPTVIVVANRDQGTPVDRMLARDPFWVAHRGGDADRPEMSMVAYRHALARGVDAVEVSLARTSDGVWFGLHDPTLDRTSGTAGFVASQHTWADVRSQRITQVPTNPRHRSPEPYLGFPDLVQAVGDGVAVFVDPKAVPEVHYPELLDLMDSLVDDPRGTFVAKSYYLDRAWAVAARKRGIRTWGYYYAKDLAGPGDVLAATQRNWDMLGLDVAAPAATWQAVRSYHKPVIAHVVRTQAQVDQAERNGAQGLMVSHLSLVPA
jgi:glycerophosphoryl diester phosphodiesterase